MHDECNWKTFFYDNKHDLRDVIDAIVMKHIKQKDIVKYLKKGEANEISFTYNRGDRWVKCEELRFRGDGACFAWRKATVDEIVEHFKKQIIMGYICTRCGGTNVACEAIVNPNTGKIIDYFDGAFMHAICSDCENEVVISNVEGVKYEIDLRFLEFVERTGKEPEYVECQIVWKETGDDKRVTIKLSLSINDDDNDNVFYYCNGIESFQQLAEYGMREFIVTYCWSFF